LPEACGWTFHGHSAKSFDGSDRSPLPLATRLIVKSGPVRSASGTAQIGRQTWRRGLSGHADDHQLPAFDRHRGLYRQALATSRELNKPDDEAIALEGHGVCHLHDGDIPAGTTHSREALAIYEHLSMRPDIARIQTRWGVADPGDGPGRQDRRRAGGRRRGIAPVKP
jgi:hypothetical protein